MADTVVVYRDRKGEWRWRRREEHSANIIADSSEGYIRRVDCEDQDRKVNAGPDVEFYSEDGALLPDGKDNDVDDSWQDNEPENQPDQ